MHTHSHPPYWRSIGSALPRCLSLTRCHVDQRPDFEESVLSPVTCYGKSVMLSHVRWAVSTFDSVSIEVPKNGESTRTSDRLQVEINPRHVMTMLIYPLTQEPNTGNSLQSKKRPHLSSYQDRPFQFFLTAPRPGLAIAPMPTTDLQNQTLLLLSLCCSF